MRKSNWQGKIQQWAAGQRQDEKKRGTGSGSRTQEQKGEVQGRKKKIIAAWEREEARGGADRAQDAEEERYGPKPGTHCSSHSRHC